MELDQLEILESKITQAVELIETLRRENQELRHSNRELRSELESRDLLIEQVKEENQSLQRINSESSLSKETEEKIRSKVENMLSRLDELQLNI